MFCEGCRPGKQEEAEEDGEMSIILFYSTFHQKP